MRSLTAGLVTDHHMPALGENATASFSPDRLYRYTLTRSWGDDRALVAFVMLNPSTADAFVEDPTVRRCIGYARRWGYGGITVLNLFALRATQPAALYRHPDPIGPDNDRVLDSAAHRLAYGNGLVVAAWGVHGAHRNRAAHVAQLLRHHGLVLHHLGLTKHGHPRHPLYLPGDATPTPMETTP